MCRCGKTIMFQKIAFDYFDTFDVIIYVCPRLNLIENMISRWQKIFKNVNIAELSSSGSKNCIRDNELKRIPFLLIVGEKEMEAGGVALRIQGEGDKGTMSLEEFTTFFNSQL